MPRKFVGRRRVIGKKKGWRKGKGAMSRQATTVQNVGLRPIPSRFITKMKYADAFSLSAAGMSSYVYNLNSIYDPDRTGIGHQPFAFDQLATLYNRYRVISTRYRVCAVPGTDTGSIQIAALPTNDAPPISNVSEARENPRCKYVIQNAQGKINMLTGKVYIPALMGRTKQQYMADDRYQATFGQSPNEAAILNIGGSSISQVDVTMDCVITLNYVVEMFDVNKLSQS